MKVIHFISLILLLLFTCCITSEANQAQIIENYGKIPLSFTINNGQYDPQVKFTTRGSGCTMFFTQEGTTFLLSRETEESISKRAAAQSIVYLGDPSDIDIDRESFALKVKFLNANPDPEVIGENRLPGNSNYFIGNDSSKWQTNVANYEKVRLRNLYDGIDLVYYGNNSSVKYDFVVKPGEDYSRILLTYDLGEDAPGGALSINKNGEMVVSTPLGDVIERAPYAYQLIDGKEVEVEISYEIVDGDLNRFGFQVGDYDPEYPLIVDPELVYSTFLGGSGGDGGRDIAVDSSGNAYITGWTDSSDFPTTAGAYDVSHNGNNDVFVIKLNASGTALEYSTFIGGSSSDNSKRIIVDNSGNAYLVGSTTSSDFPTVSAYDVDYNGGASDAFVAKLNASGNQLLYSTYLGSSGNDAGSAIAIDGSGNAYIAGNTTSSNFPTTTGAFDQSYNGGNYDAIVVKLNTLGDQLIFSTYLGGSSQDMAVGIVVDGSDNAYVAGLTYSSNFPTTSGAYDEIYNGGLIDEFIVKINTSGSALVYSTFIGGSGVDDGFFIDIDGSGNAIIVGITDSSDFPTTTGAFDETLNGGYDTSVIKLNATGNALLFSTYLGGTNNEEPLGMAVDGNNNIYITGVTPSTDFPITTGAYDETHNGNVDAFVSKLNSTGSVLDYSTFLGGSEVDAGYGIFVDNSGYVYVTGVTNSSTFPITTGSYDEIHNGIADAFVAKFSFAPSAGTITVTSPNGAESWTASTAQNITWTSTNVTNVKLEYSTNNGTNWTEIIASTAASAGSYSWTVPIRPSTNCKVKISDASDAGINDVSDATFTIQETTGNTILFVSYRDGNGEIYVMNPDGSNQTNLTNNSAPDQNPSWSPDGSKIFFASRRDGNYEIYVMDADGSNPTRLTNNSLIDWEPSLSPEGSKIVFSSFRDPDYEIFIMDPDGSNQTNLTNNSDSHDQGPSWSPDGSKISFTSRINYNYEIYVMDVNGSNVSRLTNNPAVDSVPSWSPDGSKIAFTSQRDIYYEIYVMNTDGSNQTRITNISADNYGPSWSPDGSQIAFHSTRDSNNEIYVMNADGSNQTRLTNNLANDFYPSWARPVYHEMPGTVTLTSPNGGENWTASTTQNITWTSSSVTNVKLEYTTDNGTNWTEIIASTAASAGSYSWTIPIRPSTNCKVKISDASDAGINDESDAAFTITESTDETIAFQSNKDGNAEIYVMNPDGSNKTRLTNNSAADSHPSWSPDGTKIAFYSVRDGNEEIYVMNPDGSNQTRLTNNPSYDRSPDWSPDGSQIAFTSMRDGNWEIYIMNPDGSNQTNITNNSVSDWGPSWSPDGLKITYTSYRNGNDEIYVMNADGSNQTNLTNNSVHDNYPSWSPDGSEIAFKSERDGNYEIYVMNPDGSNQTRLTNNPAYDRPSSWSPDGSQIAFSSDRDGNFEIYIMNADG
ncbi:MAG TPA: DUF5050 domain-containing protein, partial [Bacteroides sp.]|nr:DUF5050 domain-containing protein [Bacteroides sp.]